MAWIATIFIGAYACASPGSSVRRARVTITGSWGGVGAGLEAPEGEDARLELDCAHGSIAGPLAVAADGSFDWTGTLVFERGGPIRKVDTEKPAPAARYRGRLDGERLTMTIEPASGRSADVVLVRGRAPRIRKCR